MASTSVRPGGSEPRREYWQGENAALKKPRISQEKETAVAGI
jgi:hypothetical protein